MPNAGEFRTRCERASCCLQFKPGFFGQDGIECRPDLSETPLGIVVVLTVVQADLWNGQVPDQRTDSVKLVAGNIEMASV